MNKRGFSVLLASVILLGMVMLFGALSTEIPAAQASGRRRTPTPSGTSCGFICEAKANIRATCGAALQRDAISRRWIETDAFVEDALYRALSNASNLDLTPFGQGMLICGSILSVAKEEKKPWVNSVLGRLPQNCDYKCQVKFYANKFCGSLLKSVPNNDLVLQAALSNRGTSSLSTAFIMCAVAHDTLLKDNCGWLCEVDKEVRRVCKSFFASNRAARIAYETWLDDIENRVTVLLLDMPIKETALLICNTLQE
ncbi:MAG: hypothetical protein J7551_02570 [Chloroflexi bacterium]|jgi:hypothetical protein|nr:hypothetical protein [Chloroflexota bacterium]